MAVYLLFLLFLLGCNAATEEEGHWQQETPPPTGCFWFFFFFNTGAAVYLSFLLSLGRNAATKEDLLKRHICKMVDMMDGCNFNNSNYYYCYFLFCTPYK